MRHLLLRSVSNVLLPPFFCNRPCDIIGVNGESSFESALLKRAPGCEVWGFDFSVGGVRASCPFHVIGARLLSYLLDQWGPEITDDPELRHRGHFQAWALGGSDAHGENDGIKFWTLDSLMKHFGMRPIPR